MLAQQRAQVVVGDGDSTEVGSGYCDLFVGEENGSACPARP
jgi:hypothetical protein